MEGLFIVLALITVLLVVFATGVIVGCALAMRAGARCCCSKGGE